MEYEFEEIGNDHEIVLKKERFDAILRNAKRLERLATEILDVSRINDQSLNDSDKITISVKDTGTGIHPAILSNLFSIFSTKSDNGTGLGLFISKNIIEAHGGQMWGKNNINKKGATFSFSLPCK